MAVPEYIKGEQSGWDHPSERWRTKEGRFCTRDVALGLETQDGYIVNIDFAPTSGKLEAVHRMMGGLLDISGYDTPDKFWGALVATEKGDTADPMPSDILAMMKLAEYFCRVEGDVWQTIEVPLTVGLKQLVVEGSDKGLERDVKELYDALDMLETLTQLWLCTAIYGQSFPLEVYDKNVVNGVLILNPKYMRVGKSVSMGRFSLDLIPETEAFREQLKQQDEKLLMYNAFTSDWNEQMGAEGNVPLKPDFCHPVRGLAPSFNRYVVPPLSRAFRAISTRQILEELIRATIEGYRNQLYIFKLGSKDTDTSAKKLQFFQSLISGASGDRTGHLIWTWDLDVQIVTPEPLDKVLGSDKWHYLTQHIFRQLGISMRLVSGESPLREGRGAEEADIRIFLERLEFWRRRIEAWAMGFNRRWAERTKVSKKSKANLPQVKFGRIFLELEELIRSLVMPLTQAGLVSKRTALETSGFNFETELQRKKEEEKDLHLFAPTPTFAQTTVSPGTPEKQALTGPRGRPKDVSNPKQLLKVAASEAYTNYHGAVVAQYEAMLVLAAEDKDEAIRKFISALAILNAQYMREAAQEGYEMAGGSGEIDKEYIGAAIDWNNSHLAGFEEALLEADEEELEKMKRRAEMYAREGDKIAFMYGVFVVMRQEGALGWRRVLHPELSLTGPCDLCIADSRLVHPIEESFFEPHPEGVCTAQSVYFYRTPQPAMEIPIVFPVPMRRRSKERIVRRQR